MQRKEKGSKAGDSTSAGKGVARVLSGTLEPEGEEDQRTLNAETHAGSFAACDKPHPNDSNYEFVYIQGAGFCLLFLLLLLLSLTFC